MATVMGGSPSNQSILSGEFSTQDDHPWQKPQLETKHCIEFEPIFVTTPKVLAYLKELDAGSGSSIHVRTTVTNIDVKGFTIHINMWGDTILSSGIASWVAYPSDKDYIARGTANTMDIRPWDKPQLQNSNGISFNFGGSAFWKDLQVFIAFNSIDIASSHNLRIKAYGSNISTTGSNWHIGSWADTVLYSASISLELSWTEPSYD